MTTHADLVRRAATWLRKGGRFDGLRRTACSVVTTEVGSAHNADAWGWSTGGYSVQVECKATRSDFRADAKKYERQHPEHDVGDFRYYMTPAGLVQPDEVPDRWGLVECRGNQVRIVKHAQRQPETRRELEMATLVSCLRRIPEPAKGVNVSVYTYRASMVKRPKATLHIVRDCPDEPVDRGV